MTFKGARLKVVNGAAELVPRLSPASFAAVFQRLVPVGTLAVVLVVVLIALDGPRNSFRLPDDNINYVFTRTLAETGKLYYEEPYTGADAEDLLHPRGALSHDGRVVPVYFFGLPVLYAPFWVLMGEGVRYVAVALSLGVVVALANAGGVLMPDRKWLAWAAVLGAAPLLYMFSRPFMNVLPALLFFSVGANILLRYVISAGSDRRYLAGASAAFALAAFMRYELAIFQTLLVAMAVLHLHRDLLASLRPLALYATITFALFLAPVLVLNEIVYGSPFAYGYGLLNETYFPERGGLGEGPQSLVDKARAVLLPSYPIDLRQAVSTFTFQIAGVAPVFIAVGAVGAGMLARRGDVSRGVLLAALGLAAYVFLYRGAGVSLHSDSTTPNFEASVQRYSMPLFVACYFLAVLVLSRLTLQWAAGLAAVLAVIGVGSAVRGLDGNILEVRYWTGRTDTEVRMPLLQHTEGDAIIYTDSYDKVLGLDRHVAAWWGGGTGTREHGFFRPDEVARSIERLVDEMPVYLFFADHDYVMPRLEPALSALGLAIAPTDLAQLYRVQRTGSARSRHDAEGYPVRRVVDATEPNARAGVPAPVVRGGFGQPVMSQ